MHEHNNTKHTMVVLAVCRGTRPINTHACRAVYSSCESEAEELAEEEAADALESERESAIGLR